MFTVVHPTAAETSFNEEIVPVQRFARSEGGRAETKRGATMAKR